MNKSTIKKHFTAILPEAAVLTPDLIQTVSKDGKRFWSCALPQDNSYAYVLIDTEPDTYVKEPSSIPSSIKSIYPSYIFFIGENNQLFRVSGNELVSESTCLPWPSSDNRPPRASEPTQSPLPLEQHDPAKLCELTRTFEKVHDLMRSRDGLQPPEALDELLGILFVLIERDRQGVPPLWPYRVIKEGGRVSPEPSSSHAQRIRGAQHSAIEHYKAMGNGIHGLSVSRLSDETLSKVVTELLAHHYSAFPIDIKSAALRAFLSSTLRRGLGIYLTPDAVVECVIDILRPPSGSKVLDPACGSGSFLLHTLFHWRKKGLAPDVTQEMWGVDFNSRVLRAAEVNLVPLVGSGFHHWNGDSLRPFDTEDNPPWFQPSTYDYIFTNPPFGVFVEEDILKASSFGAAQNRRGEFKNRVGSEIVFIERCLDLLKPGGILAIVVPNSVVNTITHHSAREFIDTKGQLFGVLSLPPETFAITGTQSTTSVLFFQRRSRSAATVAKGGKVFFAPIKNVGYDHTGRPRKGNELPAVVDDFRLFLSGTADSPLEVGRILDLKADHEFAQFGSATTTKSAVPAGGTIRLKDCARIVRTGRTPSRNSYTEEGHFIIKVGNLTGTGINWLPRDRNFVDGEYINKIQRGRVSEGLLVQKNDILLTSSAHSVKYIAGKVDIVDAIPDFVNKPCTFVGEIMLIRPDPEKLAPHYLLAYLRSKQAQSTLQAMVRGQTAHLMPRDARDLEIPLPAESQKGLVSELDGLIKDEIKASVEAAQRTRSISTVLQQLFASG